MNRSMTLLRWVRKCDQTVFSEVLQEKSVSGSKNMLTVDKDQGRRWIDLCHFLDELENVTRHFCLKFLKRSLFQEAKTC